MKQLSTMEIYQLAHRYNIPINNIFSRDTIPQYLLLNKWYIVNLDRSDGTGTHWTCFYNGSHFNFYFDSFGFVPPSKVEKVLNDQYNYNTMRIQSLQSSSCGWYCLMIIREMNRQDNTLDTFTNILNKFINDSPRYNESVLERYWNDVCK